MFHRNNEQAQVCDTCRHWSEMVAQCKGGLIQALCLHPTAIDFSEYTTRYHSCDKWQDGHLGAVDQPGGDPYDDHDGAGS